jgi:sRNA-binding carbon storage regulator CsrA
MLKLARREDQSLVIITPTGEEIKILVMDAFDGFARLGIETPTDYETFIEELLPRFKGA